MRGLQVNDPAPQAGDGTMDHSIHSIVFIGISRRALCVLTTGLHPIDEEELNPDKELAD